MSYVSIIVVPGGNVVGHVYGRSIARE
jgi:hypothetical protein